MKYTYIIALFVLIIGLSSCFQKQEAPSDVADTPLQQEIPVESGVKSEEQNSEDADQNSQKNTTENGEKENEENPQGEVKTDISVEASGSQVTSPEQQKIIDESVDELESVLTEDIISEIFSDVK